MTNLWQRIERLRGRELRTVTGKPFTIEAIEASGMRIVPSTGRSRLVPRRDIERAAGLGIHPQSLTTSDVRQSGASDWNPAYVVAILRAAGTDVQTSLSSSSFLAGHDLASSSESW